MSKSSPTTNNNSISSKQLKPRSYYKKILTVTEKNNYPKRKGFIETPTKHHMFEIENC